jgi:hypothetical protein
MKPGPAAARCLMPSAAGCTCRSRATATAGGVAIDTDARSAGTGARAAATRPKCHVSRPDPGLTIVLDPRWIPPRGGRSSQTPHGAKSSGCGDELSGEGCLFVEQFVPLEAVAELSDHAVEEVALGGGLPVAPWSSRRRR